MQSSKLPSFLANLFEKRRPRSRLPKELEKEVIADAMEKRQRKDDRRRIIYRQQTRLGLFP